LSLQSVDCLCWCSRTPTSPSLHITTIELRASHHQVKVFWHVLSCSQGALSCYTTDDPHCLVYTTVHKLWWVEISHTAWTFYCVHFHVLGPLNKMLEAIHSGQTEMSMPWACNGSIIEFFVDRMHKVVYQWPQLHSRWVSLEQASCIKWMIPTTF